LGIHVNQSSTFVCLDPKKAAPIAGIFANTAWAGQHLGNH
jgi:hypothetical protein